MPTKRKLLGAAAFAAALAGGGVAGALIGTPGVSLAQEDGGTSTTVDDDTTTTDDTTTDDGAAEGECDPGEGHFGRGRGPGLRIAAETIGVSIEDLVTALRDGASIASVAEDNDVAVQDVIDAMIAEASEHIDRAVANGRLTEDEAAEKKAELSDRITELVNRDGLPLRGRGHRGPGAPDANDDDSTDTTEESGGS